MVKKSIIAENDNSSARMWVSEKEKEAIAKMRDFDRMVKVVFEYEQEVLAVKEKKKVKEIYLKEMNAKLEN